MVIIVGMKQTEGDYKRPKGVGSNDTHEIKTDGEGNSGKTAEASAKPAEPPKQDYIHVRARRGQATDSHSLAERVMTRLIHFSFTYVYHYYPISCVEYFLWIIFQYEYRFLSEFPHPLGAG